MNRRLFLSILFAFSLALLPASGPAQIVEQTHARGNYVVECWKPDGTLRWRQEIKNIVTTVGKNLALDTYLTGSVYTATGPYIGLITATLFGGVTGSDTMASHVGWLEAGAANNPTYSSPRKTPTWTAAAGGIKEFAVPVQFVMLSTGTLRGAFLVYGTGASSVIDSTGGVLYSAAAFDNTYGVEAGDLVKVSYATSM